MPANDPNNTGTSPTSDTNPPSGVKTTVGPGFSTSVVSPPQPAVDVPTVASAPTPTPTSPAPTAYTPPMKSSSVSVTEEAPEAVATTTEPPEPKRKFPIPKKLLFILGGILLLLLIVFLVVKVVLPKLGGGGESEGEKATITWWGLWEDDSIVAPLIAEYETANPNITINYVKQSKVDYRERLTNALAKGEGPDIFRFHNSWVPMFSSELDKLPSSVMSDSEYVQTFYPVSSSDMASKTGGFLGIPLEYDGIALFVNEDIFASAGKPHPTTWDEVRTLAGELTIRDEQGLITQSGASLGTTGNVDHWPEILALMMVQNGADLADPTNNLAADALTFYTLFSGSSGSWDTTLPTSTLAFANGNVAMYFAPSWRIFEINKINSSLNYSVIPAPQLPKDSASEPDIAYATYWVEGVWARSAQRETAWSFLNFMVQSTTLEKFFLNASNVRLFGEPYPRVDMRELLITNQYLGAIISQASDAESWYLASRTWDGPTGINSLINSYYEDAVNAVNSGEDAQEALFTTAQGVAQVLGQYKVQ